MLEAARSAGGDALKLLAVTLLTHLDEDQLEELDLPGDGLRRVRLWSAMARRCGCSGVVCSPLEVAELRVDNPRPFLLVTPGIRSRSARDDDQRRTATAAESLAAGADLLVVGRPITRAGDPERALAELGREMSAS
jgi:orotidine-5'-phosphate decarboxylase